MNKELLRVGLRQQAFYLPVVAEAKELTPHTLALVAEMRNMGFCFSEPLLHAVNSLSDDDRQTLLDVVNEAMGTNLNWAALVRSWLTPTGESVWDHFLTFIANSLDDKSGIQGTTLPCGHLIPDGTFPLERYTGCPFCGRPFQTASFVYKGQGSSLRLLQLWGDKEMHGLLHDLLQSSVPLDATQRESLKVLLHHLPLPAEVDIQMKETRMLVIDCLVEKGLDEEAGRLFSTPNDVLRYLWYQHTGYVQIIQPKTILHTLSKNRRWEDGSRRCVGTGVRGYEDGSRSVEGEVWSEDSSRKLRLKYDRPWCRRVARWLNSIASTTINHQPSTIHQSPSPLESMHAKRGMWVRFIRALRLAEYAKKPGYEPLRTLLDRFYRQDYEVWQGKVDRCRQAQQTDETLRLLKQRPGLFARCLFPTMLAFGQEPVIRAFREVMTEVAPRLLLTLGGQAELYFDRQQQRIARPLTGLMKTIPPHPLLDHYTDEQLSEMQQTVRQLYLEAMHHYFASLPSHPSPLTSHLYIDPQLFNIPVSVGDRSATVQDISAALQGTRFPVEGDSVRLFLQWGKDLPAQRLDMDLSCHILTDSEVTVCAYFNLVTPGAKHSGDIREIPDYVGTAEYVELSLPELKAAKARRVVFTCNAYSDGELSPNLMVGWMSAKQPMTVSNETGVAYDPSTVQHMVRITATNLSKGLIFGVLDVDQREITWLEIPFDGQTVLSINPETIEAYLRRLRSKPTYGEVLMIKAEAQHLTIVDNPDDADEVYSCPASTIKTTRSVSLSTLSGW